MVRIMAVAERRRGAAALLLGTLALIEGASGAAAGCRSAPQGEGRVVAIMDGRGFRNDDGREVRLSGIEVPAERRAETAATLSALLLGRDVTLHGDGDAPDRYGRQPAFVFVDGAAISVQAQLLVEGHALNAGDAADPGCRAELRLAEAQARGARRGVWADAAAIKNAENPGDILAGVGRFIVVVGRVLSVREAGATVYLNFGRRWTRDFAVTISRRATTAFAAAGRPLKSFEGQRILVRGWVENRGGPRIEVRGVGQIEVPGINDSGRE